jgi:hypothetical protein
MTTLAQAKAKVDAIIGKYVSGAPASTLIPPKAVAGKVYEAVVLGYLIENFVALERLRFRLVGGTQIYLKTSPGPINVSYPHFAVYRDKAHVANMFTDVEFLTLSCALVGNNTPTSAGDLHELDILIVNKSARRYPKPDEVWLGVECKHTSFEKNLLREALGIRRELSVLTELKPTAFSKWPTMMVRANLPSSLLVCSSDPRIYRYSSPGPFFGIDFHHVPI